MLRRTWILAALAALAAPWAVAASEVHARAERSAREWLALVDAGSYSASWHSSGSGLRSAISAQAWAQGVGSVRGPLGPLKQRTLESAQAARTLPGAPDGQYVMFRFGTAFENKAAAIETVTAVLEPDGSWRVVGYFVH